jgi:hypothetical protein
MSNGNGSLSPSGDVVVITDLGEVEVINDTAGGDVSVTDDDVLTQIITGDQGPPGPRGNSVLYGYGPPSITTGVNGDFYIDLRTALMYGPKAGGAWPPGFSLIGPIGPVGPQGPQGPVGSPGNTIRNGSGPPDPSLGVAGDFYIDTTNHVIYGPKSNTSTNWGTGTSLIGPTGPTGPVGPVGPPTWLSPPVPWAPSTAYNMGPPAPLVTNAGASYAPNAGHISGVDFASDNAAGLWTMVAAAGSPGSAIAQVYVGDTPPTGVQNSSLWWNSTDGCLYVYFFDGDSHQWVIAAPIPDLSGYLQLAGGTMTGALTLAADPTSNLQAATKHYVDIQSAFPEAPTDGSVYGRQGSTTSWQKAVPLAGGTMTGLLVLSADPTAANGAATKHYVDANAITDAPADGYSYGRNTNAWGRVVPLAGGTMTGFLTLSADPTANLHAVTKQYADTKAPLASPAFTGNPTAPTQAVDDNSTKLATTAYVTNQLSGSGDGTPAMDGTAARGTSTHGARADHVHPTDTSRAPINSPTFTGVPAAPTASPGTSTTQLATTAFVGAAVTGAALTPSSTTPVMDGAGTAGVATTYSRGDHQHPTDTTRAPLASPTLTGTPTSTTPAVDNNSTNIATTAYVQGQGATATPAMDGTAAAGTSTKWAHGDHVHPTDTSRAPLASPSFSGNVTIGGTVLFTGVGNPSSLTGNTNNWSPSGLGISTVFRIASTTPVNLTGLVAQTAGTELTLINIGTNAITLTNLDSSSSAANQFNLGTSAVLNPANAITIWYDGTSSCWRPSAGSGSGGGAAVYVQDAAPVGALAGSLWWQSSTGLLFVYYNDGNSTQWVYAASMIPAQPAMYVAGGRFQFVSSTQCQLIPFKGDALRIQGIVYSIPAAGITISNTGLTQNLLYYCYAYMASGVMTLELSTTTHVTDTTPGNVGTEIKSGDNSRSLVGMVYTGAGTPGVFFFNSQNKGVRSWFNRQALAVNSASLGANSGIGSSYTVVSGSAGYVAWLGETVMMTTNVMYFNATAGVILTCACWLDGAAVGNPAVINTDGSSRVNPAANSTYAGPATAGTSDGWHNAYAAANINTGSCTAYSASSCSLTLFE